MTKLAGVYGSPMSYDLKALISSLRAFGYGIKERNPSAWRDDQLEPFDLVLVSGMHGKRGDVARAYAHRGTPVLVIDFGYINRADEYSIGCRGKYYQVGLNGLNWVPRSPRSPDRLYATGMHIQTRRKAGNAIVICGQKPGDAAHGMARHELERWAYDAFLKIRLFTDLPIYWKPHPESLQMTLGGIIPTYEQNLHDLCIDAAAIVTYNSNIGHEALLAGVPVFCDASAPYAEIAQTDLRKIATPVISPYMVRQNYFSRLAWGQWTLDEMTSGATMKFMRSFF